MKYFRYYWYDSQMDERVVGIIIANNESEARNKLQKEYVHIDTSKFIVNEIEFSKCGCCEVFYG